MVKKRKPIFLKTVLLIVLLLLVEAAVIIFITKPDSTPISGYSINDLSNTYKKYFPISRTFLLVQWSAVALLLLFSFFKSSKIKKHNKELSGINVSSALKKSKTSLDALFLILKDKKKLSIKAISDAFEIDQDLAIEWSRILESGDLVTIDYPSFGSPVVRLIEEKVEVTNKDKNEGSSKEDSSKKIPQKNLSKKEQKGNKKKKLVKKVKKKKSSNTLSKKEMQGRTKKQKNKKKR